MTTGAGSVPKKFLCLSLIKISHACTSYSKDQRTLPSCWLFRVLRIATSMMVRPAARVLASATTLAAGLP